MGECMKYRKKPVIIEAEHLTFENIKDVAKWCSGYVKNIGDFPYVVIQTLEGDMLGAIGDYIIRGVKGEFYPCKPDIFSQTYEKVE